MARAKTIGVDEKERRLACAHCKAPFDSSDFSAFMSKSGSGTVNCAHCQKPSFFQAPRTGVSAGSFKTAYSLILTLGSIPGALALAYVGYIFYTFYTGSASGPSVITLLPIFLGLGLSAVIIKFSLKLLRWNLATLHTSSVIDFETT